jgi:hypothetical protein
MVSGTSMSGERSTTTMLMDYIPWCPCCWHVIQLRDRVVHVLDEVVLDAEATKGRDLRVEVRRIWSGASRDRPRDVVWLDFRASHPHLIADCGVPSEENNLRRKAQTLL